MKKKLFLLPIFAGLLLSGCKFTIFGKTIYLFEKKPEQRAPIDDVVPEDTEKHANKIYAEPSVPFYLKVGETKSVSVRFDTTPENDSEKLFRWEIVSGPILIPNNVSDKKIDVTGIGPGTATLRATNTFNQNLTKDFTIYVLDFDEYDYVWQFSDYKETKDVAKEFGYDTEVKNGLTNGTANLGNISWTYNRDPENYGKISSGDSALKFGTGDAFEHYLDLEATNTKTVKKVVIETGSANGLANVSVTVGETSFISAKPNQNVQTLTSSDSVAPTSGDIKIRIENEIPDVDPTIVEVPMPGAIYIRSILIIFEKLPVKSFKITDDSAEKYKTKYVANRDLSFEGIELEKTLENDEVVPLNLFAELYMGRIVPNMTNAGEASNEQKEVILTYTPLGASESMSVSYFIKVSTGFTLTRVSKMSDIDEDSRYLVVSPNDHLILKGSVSPSNMFKGDYTEYDPTLVCDEHIELLTDLINDYVNFESTGNDKFKVKTKSGGYLGVKDNDSNTSACSNPQPYYADFNLAINNSKDVVLSCDYEKVTTNQETGEETRVAKTKWLGSNGGKNFSLYTSEKQVLLYKIDN